MLRRNALCVIRAPLSSRAGATRDRPQSAARAPRRPRGSPLRPPTGPRGFVVSRRCSLDARPTRATLADGSVLVAHGKPKPLVNCGRRRAGSRVGRNVFARPDSNQPPAFGVFALQRMADPRRWAFRDTRQPRANFCDSSAKADGIPRSLRRPKYCAAGDVDCGSGRRRICREWRRETHSPARNGVWMRAPAAAFHP